MHPSRLPVRWALQLALVLPLLAAHAKSAPKPAAPPAAQAARTFIAVPFSLASGVPPWLGVACAETLYDAVVQRPSDSYISQKQLDSVLRRRDLTLDDPRVVDVAPQLVQALGATDELTGTVKPNANTDGYVIEAHWTQVGSGKVVKHARVEGAAETLPLMLHKLAGDLLGAAPQAGPRTKSAQALESVTNCGLQLERQAINPRARATLTGERLAPVDAVCTAALAEDPQQGLAHAYMALVIALRGNPAEARVEAAAAQSPGRFVPMGVLADWFAARRAGDLEGAQKALEAAVTAHPGFLHGVGYLAEDREEAQDDQGALVWWNRYLERSPGHPFATARAGRALARLGKKDEAIAITQKAIARSPENAELMIELASRYIDADKRGEAEKVLLKVQTMKPERPLAALRLGYLYFTENKDGPAREQLLRAVAGATRQDESRTRAIAYADLARIAGRAGKLDAAVEALWSATRTGLRKLPCDSKELVGFHGQADFDQVCAAAPTGVGDESIDDDEQVNLEE